HHRIGDPALFEISDQLSDLSNPDPENFVDLLRKGRLGLAGVRDRHHGEADPPGILREDEGELAVAGDQPDLARFGGGGEGHLQMPRSAFSTKETSRSTSGTLPHFSRACLAASFIVSPDRKRSL